MRFFIQLLLFPLIFFGPFVAPAQAPSAPTPLPLKNKTLTAQTLIEGKLLARSKRLTAQQAATL